MAINDFKPFATGAGANVTPQAEWEALAALSGGFQAGVAKSSQMNKAFRQASFIAAALAQYTADKSGEDVLDDGDVAGFIAKMSTAFAKDFQPLDETLSALAALSTGANKLPYFTAADTASLTALTSTGRDIIGKATVADVLTYLGLGDVAKAGVAGGLLASDGYITLPLIIGGVKTNVILQWVTGPTAGAETVNYPNVTFPVTFPNACLFAAPFTVGNNTTSADQIFQAVSWTTSTAKVFPQWFGSGSQGLVHPIILAIGW
ncbi:gp53-like domain-containing protein [Enterobacter roggenkampii]|uniref:gp53-like domain-containing protein n=1 Tax=Enterobacter roggenkampii TaxID=1812935 RepID=UPI003F4450B9